MATSSLIQSFRYAFSGLRYVLSTGRNARIQVSIAGLVALTAAWLDLPASEWALLVLTMGAVLAAEAGNTSLEAVVDLASPEVHELAKIAKDAAAAAVLCLAIAAAVVGFLVLGPPLVARIME